MSDQLLGFLLIFGTLASSSALAFVGFPAWDTWQERRKHEPVQSRLRLIQGGRID